MEKTIVTADELRNMIQERISNGEESDGDCKEVKVDSLRWNEMDELGNNWDVPFLGNPAGCENVVMAIIAEFKQKYNIEDP